ncbi:cellulase family glycosylhydrolase [Kiritimatiellota bacterium B12222]|nr:cellulase family glycosylhydrolase [Kiritimatiellota bacterium B12222]
MSRYIILLVSLWVSFSVQAEVLELPVVFPDGCAIQLKTHNFTIETLDQVHAMGFKVVRRGFYWTGVEKEKGVYDFSDYDAQMAHAKSLGLTVVGVLFNVHKEYENDGQGGVQTEAGRKGFANFGAALATHYRDQDVIWEIWNEPNVRTFWRKNGKHNSEPFAQEYTDLVKEVVPAMLAANPDAFVVAGSVSNYWQPSYDWTKFCFEKGILETGIRGWSVHPYGVKTPEEFSVGHQITRGLLKEFGHPDLPMINTERGFAVKETHEGWSGGSIEKAREYQAWYLVRQFMMDQLNGVNLTVWYEWDGDKFGLVEEEGTGKRPAYFAAVEMMAELNGYTLKGRLPTDSDLDYVVEFTNEAGDRKLVVWTAPPPGASPDETSNHTLTLPLIKPAANGVKASDLEGLPVENEALVFALTGKPEYYKVPAGLALGEGIAGEAEKKSVDGTNISKDATAVDLRLLDKGNAWAFMKNTGEGSFVLEQDGHGVPMGVMSYDFTKSTKNMPYVLASAAVQIPEGASEIQIHARSPIAQQLTFRIVDAKGQTHQIKKRIKGTGGWEMIQFPLNKRVEHWGGPKDGVVHFPVTKLFLSVPKPNQETLEGNVEFAMIKAVMAKGSAAPVLGTPQEFAPLSSAETSMLKTDTFLSQGISGWDFVLGGGASGSMEVVQEDGKNVIQVKGDFSRKGKWVSATKTYHLDAGTEVQAIQVEVKSEATKTATIRVIDGSGQTHQRRGVKLPATGKWETLVIDPKRMAGSEHWDGANDGVWHPPLQKIAINLTQGSVKGSDKPELLIRGSSLTLLGGGIDEVGTYVEDFESGTGLPAGWRATGKVELSADESFKGNQSLKLERAEADALTQETVVTSEIFPARPGKWTFSGVGKSDLFSPDMSFAVYIKAEWLGAGDSVIRGDEITIFTQKENWRAFSNTLHAPAGTVAARFSFKMNKTYGSFYVDKLQAEFTEQEDSSISRVELSSEALANLFYPGDAVKLQAEIFALDTLPEAEQALTVSVRDYWGAEQAATFKVPLVLDRSEAGFVVYRAEVDVSGITGVDFQVGRYYEVHTSLEREGLEAYQEKTTFAILPEAITKQYPAKDVHFTARNWDNRVMEYVDISERIGIRQVGVYSNWSAEAPYKPMLFNGKRMLNRGIGMVGRSPLYVVEREGFENFTVEGIAQGATNWIEKFGNENMLSITLGNEPHGGLEEAKRNVKAYKAAYEAIKKVRPDFEIIGTSVGPNEDYFIAGFQDYQDVYDFHTYEDYDRIPLMFEKYEELFEKYGGRKPICSTEIGLNSQGLSRQAVAQMLIKKDIIFFACGGYHVGWFTIAYPDRDGSKEAGSRQAFNTFYGKYAKYSPKLDGVTYYHLLNSVVVKRFQEQKIYEDSTRSYLMKDAEGNCLQVLWNDDETKEVFLPLVGVGEVTTILMDGRSQKLNANQEGITLSVSRDPLFVLYTENNPVLPEELGTPAIRVVARPDDVIKGSTVSILLEGKGIKRDEIEALTPYGWTVSAEQLSEDQVSLQLGVPADTAAVEGRIEVVYAPKGMAQAALEIGIPLAPLVGAKLHPIVMGEPGGPGVMLELFNNSTEAQKVDWSVELKNEMPVNEGEYDLLKPQTAAAYFSSTSNGSSVVPVGESVYIPVEMTDVDPLTIYRVKASLLDKENKVITAERLVAGFVPAKKVKDGLSLDGKLTEAEWNKGPFAALNEERQYKWWPKYDQTWTGPEDLSAEMRFLWDEDYFYVGLKVTDDVRIAEGSDNKLWAMDGLQFLIDPARGGTIKSGKYDVAMGVGTKGPQAWYHLTADPTLAPSGLAEDIQIAYSLGENGNITYEIAIPWNRVSPFKPGIGENLGLAMIINETDAGKRGAFIGWFSGVHLKESDMIGDIILVE